MLGTKSYESWLLGVCVAILRNVATRIPSLHADCERDCKRLLSAVECHGIPFILDTMVSFAKHFDRCLADERLTLSGLCHFGPYRKGVVIPKLFKGLLLRVFHETGELRSVPNVEAIRSLRQIILCCKGFRIACPKERTYESVHSFFVTDDEVATPSLAWEASDFDSHRASDHSFSDLARRDSVDHPGFDFPGGLTIPSTDRDILDAVQLTADIVSSTLGRFDPTEWRPRHGPGAVSDLQGNHINKYDFPSWPDRLEEVFSFSEFAFANFGQWADSLRHEEWVQQMKTSEETMSKLIAVPKTYRTPRLIASEPTAHQWCQQIVRNFLMTRVASTPIAGSIAFSDQSQNQVFALEASLSGSHATIDLSSASDRISCWVIERLFRRSPTLLQALYVTRTRWIKQDIDRKQPKYKQLRKFSTMGSAVTFPVQTILFTTIAVAATLYARGLTPSIRTIRQVSKEVQVFGDDIIVPLDSWECVVGILETFGLKVNTDKTFGTGKFRESCGVDAYNGHDVSRVSVLSMPSASRPESVLSLVDTHNNFYNRGWFGVASWIKKTVESVGRYTFPVVAPDSGLLGWHSYDEVDNSHLKSRWNVYLQRREYRCSRPSASATRLLTEKNSLMLQYYTETRPGAPIRGDRLGIAEMRGPLRLRAAWDPLLAISQ